MLGWLRTEAQREGGYFFLIGLTRAEAFWTDVMEGLLDGLWRPSGSGPNQIDVLLTGLARLGGTSRAIQRTLETDVNRARLNSFAAGLIRREVGLGPDLADTARALAMYGAMDESVQSLARNWLVGAPEQNLEELRPWGINGPRPIERIVQDIFRLIALTGHSVLALDQLDPLVAHASASPASVAAQQEDQGRDEAVQQVAQGVMLLRDLTQRTLTVLSCQPNTWLLLTTRSIASARDRFREPQALRGIDSPEVAVQLVSGRLASHYRRVGFTPPHPTWPIGAAALAEAVNYTPRALLKRVDLHIQSCLDRETIVELTSLEGEKTPAQDRLAERSEAELDRLDRRFDELKAQADLSRAADPHADDEWGSGLARGGSALLGTGAAGPGGVVRGGSPTGTQTPAARAAATDPGRTDRVATALVVPDHQHRPCLCGPDQAAFGAQRLRIRGG